MDSIKPRVLAPGRYAIDVEPITPHSRNNREVHLDYLKHLKESVETLHEIVEEAKVERPLDRSLASACLYTKHSQELLKYVIGTCPKDFNTQDKKHASTPLTSKKQVTFEDQLNSFPDTSGSKPRSNTKKNRISSDKSVNKKKVEEHPRTNKSSLKTTNHVDSIISSKHTKVWKPKQVKKVWKATGKVLTYVSYQWKPTGRIFTLGEQCPLTRLTTSNVLPIQQTENVSASKTVITEKLSNNSQKPLTSYQCRNKQYKVVPTSIPAPTVNQAIDTSMPIDVAYANQQDPNKNWGSNFPNSPSSSVFKCRSYRSSFVRFGNDHFGAIMGYGDYVIGDNVICKNGVVERQNRTLVEAARTMLIFLKALMFLWVEVLSKPKAPMQLSTGPAPTFMMPRQISSGLVPNPVPAAPYVPSTNKELEILIQPMFNEYLEPPRVERLVSPTLAVLVLVNSASTPSSTTIDQDAPSPSHSPSSLELQPPISHQGVAAGSPIIEYNPFAHVDHYPFVNMFALEPSSEASSSKDARSAESTHVTQPHHHLRK
ncbi:hypothetical protein Tco_1284967 [Tanacetum coccineum]